MILQLYSDYDKCLGAYKITYILSRDYGINISVGRVYRLMKSMQLPKMSTDKPRRHKHQEQGACDNHLQQSFNQKAPNLVWASDFTYIKVNSKWYYLCIIMDLFSRKIIGWHLSSRHNVELTMTAFNKAYKKRDISYGLIFHSDQGSEYTAFSFRKLLDSCNVVQSFSKKDILLIMLVVKVSLNISKKIEPTEEFIIHKKNFDWIFLSTLKIFITIACHMVRLDIKRQMSWRQNTGISIYNY